MVNMDLEKNKAIARHFSQLWGKGELDIIDELASPDFSVYYPLFLHPINGMAAYKQHLTKYHSTFGDTDVQIEEEIAEGDKVVLRVTFSAIHQADWRGIPATGKRYKWTGIIIYHIVDGKVVEERGEEDYYTVFRQLGLLSGPLA
jgi:steroid delta-isomerase-like uncharacterized protein